MKSESLRAAVLLRLLGKGAWRTSGGSNATLGDSNGKGLASPSSSAPVGPGRALYSDYTINAKQASSTPAYFPQKVFSEHVPERSSAGQDAVTESRATGQVATAQVPGFLRRNEFGKGENLRMLGLPRASQAPARQLSAPQVLCAPPLALP